MLVFVFWEFCLFLFDLFFLGWRGSEVFVEVYLFGFFKCILCKCVWIDREMFRMWFFFFFIGVIFFIYVVWVLDGGVFFFCFWWVVFGMFCVWNGFVG